MAAARREIKWGLPEGLEVAEKLAALDTDDAKYEEMRAKFERKIAYREAKAERIRENLSSIMAERPTAE